MNKDVGSEYVDENTSTQYLKLTFSLSKVTVRCGAENFDEYRNAWMTLPPLAASGALGAMPDAPQRVELTEAKDDEVTGASQLHSVRRTGLEPSCDIFESHLIKSRCERPINGIGCPCCC